jgi:hypothetical protein
MTAFIAKPAALTVLKIFAIMIRHVQASIAINAMRVIWFEAHNADITVIVCGSIFRWTYVADFTMNVTLSHIPFADFTVIVI